MTKILSDAIHFGNVNVVSSKVEELISKKEGLQNLTSIVRLLDSLMASDHGVEQLDRLIRKLEELLKDSENFQLLTVQQAVRMVRVFAYSETVNMGRHRIVDKLIRYIEENLN